MYAPLLRKTCIAALVVFTSTAALAQTTTAPDSLGALAAMLGTDAAGKVLKLSSAQKSRINQIRANYRSQAMAVVAKRPEGKNEVALAEAKLEAIRQKSNRETLNVLTPEQKKKLVSVEVHALGGNALRIASIQKQLNLTPTQVSRIEKIVSREEEYIRDINESHIKGNMDHFERSALLHEVQWYQGERMLRVLNPTQRKQFEALKKS